MVSINYSGRLGNNLFQYCAAYIFSKKFNLNLITEPPKTIFNLPKNEVIQKKYEEIIYVTDENFIEMLNMENLPKKHYKFVGYYQLREFVLNYQKEIKDLFNIKIDQKNSVFVAYRIGDINNSRQMLPIEYYEKALDSINCNSGYISSDSPSHPNVIKLIEDYGLTLYENTPDVTIDFAKNFNNLVLSEGSFSWWMGFLSNAKNIYYNSRERFWHGDIFVFPNWSYLEYDWDLSCYDNNNLLHCKKIK